MAWSTRELADLAGTTVKAVRYYHRLGLLEESERSANGYHKRYEVPHLLRLLQIRRLSELGIPLSAISEAQATDDSLDEAIATLDAELGAQINRLEQTRRALKAIQTHQSSTYVPTDFAPLAPNLSKRQRQLLMIYSTVLSETSLQQFREQISDPSKAEEEFEQLPEDAPEALIKQLAGRLATQVKESREQGVWADPTSDAPRGSSHASQTMGAAMAALYNPAQLRVLEDARQLLT